MTRGPTVYCCRGYIGLSPSGSGVLYPIYTANGANVSFVQELGRDGEITNFIPFYDEEHFRFFSSLASPERSLGDAGIYAFLSPESSLVELSHEQVGPLVRLGDVSVSDERLPVLTRLALARIGSASAREQIGLLERFLGERIRTRTARKIAVAAQKRTLSDTAAWWERYVADQQPPSKNINPFLAFETEDLFKWLYDNSYGENWSVGLATLMKRVVYDERLFDLLARMLASESLNIGTATARDQAIIGRGLELYSALGSSQRDFADAMCEHIGTGEVFALRKNVSIEVILEFIDDLDLQGHLDAPAIDIYLDKLSSEVIDSELASNLIERVLKSPVLRTGYPVRSYYSGLDRLERLKYLIKNSGRLGLVLDAKRRSSVLRAY